MHLCTICCGSGADGQHGDGPLLLCHRCGVVVHAVCAGRSAIAHIASGTPYRCDQCDLTNYVRCNVCNLAGGTMVPASDGGYAHFQCALVTPETSYDPVTGLAHGTASKLESKRNAQHMQCMFCRNRGGAIQCAAHRCLNSMHASCMSAQWQARAEALKAQQQLPGFQPHAEPFEGLPCVLPQIHNLSIGLFALCPKHTSNVGVYRKQYNALRQRLKDKQDSRTSTTAVQQVQGQSSDAQCSTFHDTLSSLPSNPWLGLFHPESRSHFTIRPINMPATQDKAQEALRAAQEQEAFFRDVVQPYFHESVPAPDHHVPVQTLLRAVHAHMAPLLSEAAVAMPSSPGRQSNEGAEKQGSAISATSPVETRGALIASLALPIFAIDMLLTGEEDVSVTAPNCQEGDDDAGSLPDLVPTKRARLASGVSDNKADEAQDASATELRAVPSSSAAPAVRVPGTSELEDVAEQLQAHLTLQRHVTNIRLLQLVSRVQLHAPAALPPSLHLLDTHLARPLGGDLPDFTTKDDEDDQAAAGQPAVLPHNVRLIGYRGSTQPWQGAVPIQPFLSPLPAHPLPVPDPLWNSLSKMVTSAFRQWRAVVAHMHAGLADRSESVNEAPASWLVNASGRQFASPSKAQVGEWSMPIAVPQPSQNAQQLSMPSACGVCMDSKETIQDELLRCTMCKKVVVHKSCYGVPGSNKASFLCDVCRHGGGKLTPVCCMCGHIGGPVKLTRQAQWIHVFCALLSGPSWMPLPTMGPVLIDVQAAKEAQLAHTKSFTKLAEALTGPPSAMVSAVGGERIWHLLSLAHERAELYRMPGKPTPQALPNYDFGVLYAPHPRIRPPPMAQPLLIAPEAVVAGHVGTRSAPAGPRVCAVCGRTEGNAGGRLQRCDVSGCVLAFHPMCAWLDGLYVTACPPDRASSLPYSTSLLGSLGPALACTLHCTSHTPKKVKGRSQETQKALRAQEGFVMRKVEVKS